MKDNKMKTEAEILKGLRIRHLAIDIALTIVAIIAIVAALSMITGCSSTGSQSQDDVYELQRDGSVKLNGHRWIVRDYVLEHSKLCHCRDK